MPRLRFDLVGAKPFLGQQAIDHQVAEGAGMAAGLPDLRMHDDGGFQSRHVIPLLGHRPPPGILDIALKLGAQRAVIPKTVQAAVDFRGLKNEPAPFANETIFSINSPGFGSDIRGIVFANPGDGVKAERGRKIFPRGVSFFWGRRERKSKMPE